MEIEAWTPLLQEINNSVDFLNSIPNVEEHNLDSVEVLILQWRRTWINTTTQRDSNLILTNWLMNSQLVEHVEGNSQLMELDEYYKKNI